MPSNHLILCRPLLLLPSIFPSITVFSNEPILHIRWPKYWNFSFIISPSNEYSGLISFRMDRLDLLAVQGTLKSLLQHHSSKASVLQRSAFFTVQLSHPYMTTGKTIALTRRTFVGKVVSLLLNMLSRLVIILPRSKRLLISWLQSASAVILEPRNLLAKRHLIHESLCEGLRNWERPANRAGKNLSDSLPWPLSLDMRETSCIFVGCTTTSQGFWFPLHSSCHLHSLHLKKGKCAFHKHVA